MCLSNKRTIRRSSSGGSATACKGVVNAVIFLVWYRRKASLWPSYELRRLENVLATGSKVTLENKVFQVDVEVRVVVGCCAVVSTVCA